MSTNKLSFRKKSGFTKIIGLTLVTICIASFAVSYVTTVNIQASQKSGETDKKVAVTDRYTTKSIKTSEPDYTIKVTPSPSVKSIIPTPLFSSYIPKTVDVNKIAKVKSGVFTHPTPETNSAITGTLQKDQEVVVVSDIGGWCLLSDNTYVWGKFLEFK